MSNTPSSSLWQQIHSHIFNTDLLPKQTSVFFDSIVDFRLENGTLYLYSNDQFLAKVLSAKYAYILEKTASAILGYPCRVELCLAEEKNMSAPKADVSSLVEKFHLELRSAAQSMPIQYFLERIHCIDFQKNTLVLWLESPRIRQIIEKEYLFYVKTVANTVFGQVDKILFLSTDNLKDHILI